MSAIAPQQDAAAWRGMESLESRFLLSGTEVFDGSIAVGGVKTGNVTDEVDLDAQGNITKNSPELDYLRLSIRPKSMLVNFKVENYTKTFPADQDKAMSFRVQVLHDTNNDGVLQPGERDGVSILQQQGVSSKKITLAPGAAQLYSRMKLTRGSYWITLRPVSLATPVNLNKGQANYRVSVIGNATASIARPAIITNLSPMPELTGVFSHKNEILE